MRIHMIGIGGAGMSGIAEVLKSRGDVVTGSDLKESPYTKRLQEAGVTVYIGHAAEQVGDAERVVLSTAIPKTTPELLEARRRSLPVIPQAAVVTNVEFDHPDFYASLDDVLDTFSAFVSALPPDGHLVICADDPSCSRLLADAPCPTTTYGLSAGDLRAEVLTPNSYILSEYGTRRGTVELGVFGRHNVLNSLAVTGIARWLGHDPYEAARTLKDFGGVRRRFQLKGERAQVKVVDDYAHHPTELSATLEAARATTSSVGRVIAAFQPHRYSRTRKLYREFGDAFAAADAVVITEVYGAGEMPQPGVNGKLIVDAICETRRHPDVYYIPQQDAIPGVLRNVSEGGDLVLTLGAGDISQVGDSLLDVLEDLGSQP